MSEEWIKYIRDKVDKIYDEQTKIKTEIATLKLKASFWGAISGSVGTICLIAYKLLEK